MHNHNIFLYDIYTCTYSLLSLIYFHNEYKYKDYVVKIMKIEVQDANASYDKMISLDL